MERKKLNKIVVIVLMACSTIFLGIVGSFAYFMVSLGSNKNEEVSTETANISLIFSDGVPYINKNLNFGESVEKAFTIENDGTKDAMVKMSWLNIINTYLEGSLTYTLSYSEAEDGIYTEIVKNKNVPRSSEDSTITLVNGLFIPTGTKYFYKLSISLNYTDFDQTADLNAMLSTNFILEEEGFKVTFNNGNGTTTTKYISRDSTYGELPTPARDGYVFLGWFTAASGGTQVTSETKFTFNKDQTLYARWETVTENNIKNSLAKTNKTPKASSWLNFANQATTDETKNGLYTLADDYGTSYFYRGNVTDNYVKFGKWASNSTQTAKRNKPMYWRILRINGDGSVRLLYDGTKAYNNSDTSSDRLVLSNTWFHSYYEDNKFVGYMFGGSNSTASENRIQLGSPGYESSTNALYNQTSSDIKIKLENWYKENLLNYDSYIADSVFCYDRSIGSTNWSGNTGLGYDTYGTVYTPASRYINGSGNNFYEPKTNIQPVFKCAYRTDSFTKEDMVHGNGALSQKVGLITVDEAVAAGSGKFMSDVNTDIFIHKGARYFTGSPYYFWNYTAWFAVYEGFIDGTSGDDPDGLGLVPVINLTPEYFKTLIGDGTQGNPFRAQGETP